MKKTKTLTSIGYLRGRKGIAEKVCILKPIIINILGDTRRPRII